jgi:8-amino-3,8-dideoxy-alpha-D-manno-octulosonate transaminase
MSGQLAIDGGKPVRSTPLPGAYPGATIIGEEEKRAVNEVLDRRSPFRYYGPDPAYKVDELEQAIAALVGMEYAVGVTSGTAALITALRALGVGPGDEVIVPAATFYGCVNAVVACQAVPIFADLDETVSIDAASVEQVVTDRTRAIMVVHWRGVAADLDALISVGQRHGVPILEDCAQSFGAEYHGRYVGGLGTINIFSFQMNKVISAGEGGMVVTNQAMLHRRAVACQDQGTARASDGADYPPFFGENYRMSELTAALLLEQVQKLPRLRDHVRRLGSIIKESVRDLPGVHVRPMADPAGDAGVSPGFIFDSPELCTWARQALAAEGVPIKFPYGGVPVYMHDAVLQKRMWHEGPTPWDPRFYDGDAEYGAGLSPYAEELMPRVCEYHLSMDWSEQDAQDVAAGLRKVMQAVPSDLLAGTRVHRL